MQDFSHQQYYCAFWIILEVIGHPNHHLRIWRLMPKDERKFRSWEKLVFSSRDAKVLGVKMERNLLFPSWNSNIRFLLVVPIGWFPISTSKMVVSPNIHYKMVVSSSRLKTKTKKHGEQRPENPRSFFKNGDSWDQSPKKTHVSPFGKCPNDTRNL